MRFFVIPLTNVLKVLSLATDTVKRICGEPKLKVIYKIFELSKPMILKVSLACVIIIIVIYWKA